MDDDPQDDEDPEETPARRRAARRRLQTGFLHGQRLMTNPVPPMTRKPGKYTHKHTNRRTHTHTHTHTQVNKDFSISIFLFCRSDTGPKDRRQYTTWNAFRTPQDGGHGEK